MAAAGAAFGAKKNLIQYIKKINVDIPSVAPHGLSAREFFIRCNMKKEKFNPKATVVMNVVSQYDPANVEVEFNNGVKLKFNDPWNMTVDELWKRCELRAFNGDIKPEA